jgi:hypothetical protein
MYIDKEAYQKSVDQTMSKVSDYKNYLKFVELAGTTHLSARNLCAVLNANPEAAEVGTLKYWNKRQFIIKGKEKGIKILMPSPDNPKEFIGGVVFDLKQIMPSEKANQQGKNEYQHDYPYASTVKGLNLFLGHFSSAISDVRVKQSKEAAENVSVEGAMITVNANLDSSKQAQAVLVEYARFVVGKNLANTGDTDQSNFEKEFKAVTIATIMGKRLGFNMDDPQAIMKGASFQLLQNQSSDNLEKLLSDSVNKANKALFQISREFFKAREMQQDMNKTSKKSGKSSLM